MFSERLKLLRKEKSITQEELADKICVSKNKIIKFEMGRSYPSKRVLNRIALFFNINVTELIGTSETSVKDGGYNKRFNLISLGIVITVLIIMISLNFIPMFKCQKYIYPIPPGQDLPDVEYTFKSIFSSNFEKAILLV